MYINRVLLLILVLLYVFSPVLNSWVAAAPSGWYRPQLVWLGIITIVAVAMYRDSRHGN